jgi:hypothetical protein
MGRGGCHKWIFPPQGGALGFLLGEAVEVGLDITWCWLACGRDLSHALCSINTVSCCNVLRYAVCHAVL